MEWKDKLSLGDEVTLETENETEYQSKIHKMQEDDIWIYAITDENVLPGKRLYLSVSQEDAVLVFEAGVVGNEVEDGVFLTHIFRTSEIKRLQRRSAFRLSVDFQMEITVNRKTETVWCRNLSESGLGFDYGKKIEAGALLGCAFSVGEAPYKLLLTVRNCREKKKRGLYTVGCSFENISEKEKNSLRRYLFKRQLKMS